jgi:hypothetical protein
MISVKDFYDIEENQYTNIDDFSEYGSTNDQVVSGIVQAFKNHPAVYGWYISDERPEYPSDTNKWMPSLTNRYQLIKRIDPNHPTLIILGCYQGENVAAWPPALKQLNRVTDGIGFDSYPVPYSPTSIVQECSEKLRDVVPEAANRWFVIQGFSWASYPDVVADEGSDIRKARYPTLGELRTMIHGARNAGAENLLVYSYFDLKNDKRQFASAWQNIHQALAEAQD